MNRGSGALTKKSKKKQFRKFKKSYVSGKSAIGGLKAKIEKYNLKSKKMKYYAQKAIDYYQLYLSYFKKSPNAVKIAMNLGDVFYNMEKYLESGDYYLRAYMGEFGRAKGRRLLIENALLCFQKNADFSFFELLRIKGLLIRALQIYMSMDPKLKRSPKLNFILVKSVYEQGFYERALPELIQYIKRFPRAQQAASAGDLILDYFNTKNDFDGLVLWSDRILNAGVASKRFRAKVTKIREQAKLKKLQAQVEDSGSFDSFSQGKSYLQTALSQKDSGMMSIALQKALAKSKKERDLTTFLKTADIMARKEKNPTKKSNIIMSAIAEKIRVTKFHEALKSLGQIYTSSSYPKTTRDNAYQQALGLAVTLRDWNLLYMLTGKPQFKSVSNSVKAQLSDQVSDLLESPIRVPGQLAGIISRIGINDQIQHGLFKAQNRLNGSLKSMLRSSMGKCRGNSRSIACKWNKLTSVDKQSFKYQASLRRASKNIQAVQKNAAPFASILGQYSALAQSSNPHLNMIISLRLSALYNSFGNYLKGVASKNKAMAPVLNQKVKESLNSAKQSKKRCKKILSNVGAKTPVNKFCLRGINPPRGQGIFWKRSLPVPRIGSTNSPKYSSSMKAIFASESGNVDATVKLAKKYYDNKQYNLALAASKIGMGQPGAGNSFATIMGCSAVGLGYLNEAQYFLKKGENFSGLKKRCKSYLNKF